VSESQASGGSVPQAKRRRTIRRAYEPWTAVGTFFCPETMRIFCPGNTGSSFRTPTPDHEAPSEIDTASAVLETDERFLGDAAATAAASAAVAAGDEQGQEQAHGQHQDTASKLIGDLEDLEVSPNEEEVLDTRQLEAEAEAAFRSGAAAAFANGLRPL